MSNAPPCRGTACRSYLARPGCMLAPWGTAGSARCARFRMCQASALRLRCGRVAPELIMAVAARQDGTYRVGHGLGRLPATSRWAPAPARAAAQDARTGYATYRDLAMLGDAESLRSAERGVG